MTAPPPSEEAPRIRRARLDEVLRAAPVVPVITIERGSDGGSWLAPGADIRAGNWPDITARARRAVGMVGRVGR